MNKNEIRQLNSIQSSNTCYHILKELGSKNIINKESNISSNKNNNTLKNKSVSSNQISNSNCEETNSKNTVKIKIKKEKEKKEKNNINKKKKRKKDKVANLLKNSEKLKIPICKRRRSIAAECIKLNLNNLNNFNNNFNDIDIAKSFTPTVKKNIRTDKNGIEINKSNKKTVHITFLDDISPNNQITETVNIESFKQYNIVKKNTSENNLQKCNCCFIF